MSSNTLDTRTQVIVAFCLTRACIVYGHDKLYKPFYHCKSEDLDATAIVEVLSVALLLLLDPSLEESYVCVPSYLPHIRRSIRHMSL